MVCALPLLLIGALVRPIDHDEGQYVAAVALMRVGVPFRDFLYLQTPLQPWLLAPLASLRSVPLLPLLRGVNVLAAAAAAAAVMLAARAGGGSRSSALVAAMLMLVSDPLLFGGSVARNDALSAAFAAGGIGLLARALAATGGRSQLAASGLAFAAAASCKISYAVPAAASAIVVLVSWRRLGSGGVAAFVTGAAVGALPTLATALSYPAAFRFGVFEYGVSAPRQWYGNDGQGYLFSPWISAARFLAYLLLGPAPGAVAIMIARRKALMRSPVADMLNVLIGAGVIAALLPQPTYHQYLLPILPPLFAQFGALRLEWLGGRWRSLLAIGAIAGLEPTVAATWAVARHGVPLVAAVRDAEWLASQTGGPVATLSPERVAGGSTIDRRFASGPFIFRTIGLLDADEERRFHVVTAHSFAAAFAVAPPAAILTGVEGQGSPAAPRGLDAPLVDWAVDHGWVSVASPSGVLRLYIPPQNRFRSASHPAIAPAKR